MNRIARPIDVLHAVSGIVLCLAFASARAGEPLPPISKNPTMAFACMAAAGNFEYDSAAFVTKNPGPVYADLEKHVAALDRAFEAYLNEKYGFNGTSQCGQHDTLAQAKQWLVGRKENQVGRNYQLIQTDWTYSGAVSASSAASTPPATQAAAAPRNPTAFFACTSATSAVEYDSAVFESENGTANARQMRFAYAAYLQQQYKFIGAASCMPRPTQAAAEKYLKEQTPAAKGVAARRVTTGWVYKPKAQ